MPYGKPVLVVAIEAACAAIVFAALLYLIWSVGPALETRFRPVTSKIHFQSVDWTDNGMNAVVTIRFEKKRGCEFVGLAWYQSGAELLNPTFTRVFINQMVDYEELSRPTGVQIVGPWVIYMRAAHVRTRSRILAYHRCHPFWTTMSVMYP